MPVFYVADLQFDSMKFFSEKKKMSFEFIFFFSESIFPVFDSDDECR